MYPSKADVNGIEYDLNTSWQNALECLKIVNDETICDEERALAIIYKIFGFIPDDNIDNFLDKAILFLQCGETTERQNSKEVDMDFEEDFKYINASFMSDYHIDLSVDDMHFWQFIYLIQGLTENCILSRIRNLRNFDLREINDPKERRKIADAQQQVGLKSKVKISEKQKQSQNKFFKLAKIER